MTGDLLEALLDRGWTIRCEPGRIEFRTPQGISGSAYQCTRLFRDDFPPPVEDWIWDNIPLAPTSP